MIAIERKLMAKILMTHSNLLLRKLLVDCCNTPKIIILMTMDKMNMDNLYLMTCHIFKLFTLQIYQIYSIWYNLNGIFYTK